MTFHSFLLSRRCITGLGLTLVLLLSQLPTQAGAQNQPDKPAKPDNPDAVVVSSERVKVPHKHRETKRGQVKPEKFASKPQQMVKSLR